MNFDENTPRRARTIAGVAGLQIPEFYAEGQTIDGPAANMLNQTVAENFSNNLRSRVAEYIPEGSPEGTEARVATQEEAQAIVDAYAAEYEPGVRKAGGGGGGAASLTPVETEVRALATSKLKEALKAKGLKQRDLKEPNTFAVLRDRLIATHGAALTAQAEKVVAARERASRDDGDILASVAEGLGV